MDSATRAALLATMAGGPESVTSVTSGKIGLVTAEPRTNPPFVTSVTMLPAENSNPAETGPLDNPGWAEPAELVPEREFFEAADSPDHPVSLVTLVTWKQTADSCGSPALPAENPAGNTGNSPVALASLETLELIARVEFLYAGKIGLKAGGPVWNGPVALPAEFLAVLKERRIDVIAAMQARVHAIKTRTREPDTWGADDWRGFYDERAGIREFDGRLPRLEAERLTLADCAEHWQTRNTPAPHSPENGCWQCGGAGTDENGADPLTSRNCRGGVFWIHPRCWADHDAATATAAKAAIDAILGAAA